MSKNKVLIGGTIASLVFTSCASILSGSTAKVTVKSDEITTPVNLTYDNKTETNIFLPYDIKIKRGFKSTTIKASTKGYDDVVYKLARRLTAKLYGTFCLVVYPVLPLTPQPEL